MKKSKWLGLLFTGSVDVFLFYFFLIWWLDALFVTKDVVPVCNMQVGFVLKSI